MLRYIDILGLTFSLYDFWNGISIFVMFFYMIDLSEKFGELSAYAAKQATEKRKKLVGIGEVLAIIVLAFILFKLLNQTFADWFTYGNANYYGSLTAWFLAITVLSVVFKTSPLRAHDLFAPALPIQLVFAKLACFCSGCCHGFEMYGSWYFNQNTGRQEFPVQLLEACIALGLHFLMNQYQKRNKIPGSMFPLYLVLYAISRFLTEFFRADYPNVWGPLDAYQIMSIVYIALGTVLLGSVWIYNRVVSSNPKSSAARP